MGHGLSIRGDSLYCPLSFSLDSYGNCLNDCWHCYLRRLNHIWGQELNPTNPDELKKKLINGLENKNPKSSLAWALKQKKTIRWGNKTDPFQHEAESQYKISKNILKILAELKWTFVIQTMETETMMGYIDLLEEVKYLAVIQPIISPGAESDWELLERKKTTPIEKRFLHLKLLKSKGFSIAVNGEPFIPGHHTIGQFEDIIKRLKSNGINRYNTYNLHFNDFVAKRFLNLNLDIEKIWEMNQDSNWKLIHKKLIGIAQKYNIILGCPDFVNSENYYQNCNTCCGIDVKNPTTFNTHTWKRIMQKNSKSDPTEILEDTWDHIDNLEEGKKVLQGDSSQFYTMKDAGFESKKKAKGLLI